MPVRVLPLLLILMALPGIVVGQPRVSDGPSIEARLAAESLAHDARCLGHLRDVSESDRAGRIMALLRFARRLYPSDAGINRSLVDLYEQGGQFEQAASAAKVYVRTHPDDYVFAVRWMRLTMATFDTAGQRGEFLKSVIAREDLSDGIRAAAAAELCRTTLRRGDLKDAQAACELALSLDPHEPSALRMRAESLPATQQRGPVSSFKTALAVFGGNPRSMQTSWRLARLLQGAAAYDQAIRLYDHVLALSRAKRPAGNVRDAIVVDYFNAMLDAGRAGEAVALFGPYLDDHGSSLGLRGLMAEAYRSLGDDEKAREQVEAMAAIYQPLAATGVQRSALQSAELAWFDLVFRSRPAEAMRWAKEASQSDGDDPFVQRVLGAAELAGGQADSGSTGSRQAGVKRLSQLIATDPYAAAILAGHYYGRGDADKARQVILDGAGDVRTGPGWRALRAIAADRKVDIQPPPQMEPMRDAWKRAPSHLLEMGRYPERFIRVSLAASKAAPAPGEGIAVTVTVRNVSEHPVPLGRWGLLNPVVFLSLDVQGPAEAKLPNLTMATVPSPKYLGPGQEVSRTVRVDVGKAEEILAANPLARIGVTVTAVLDPLEDDENLFSSAPEIEIAPVTIVRRAMFDVASGDDPARLALGYIVRDLKQGAPAARMLAARQTALLLGHVRRVELGKAQPVLENVLTKPVLLSMTRAFLEDPSPAVRAEIISALRGVDLDRYIISLMGPRIRDVSALVRMRLIELLAGERTPGYVRLLDHFRSDGDGIVREMTAALAGRTKP